MSNQTDLLSALIREENKMEEMSTAANTALRGRSGQLGSISVGRGSGFLFSVGRDHFDTSDQILVRE